MTAYAWDPALFRGTAERYQAGRLPYASNTVEVLVAATGMGPRGLLVDFGAGPGTLAGPLSRYFPNVIAIEPDPELAEVGKRATTGLLPPIEWYVSTAEERRFEVGSIDTAVFGQSFHWMDQRLLARRLRQSLMVGGHLVLVADNKTQKAEISIPYDEIRKLIQSYLGTVRRAGSRSLPQGTRSDEAQVLHDAGFSSFQKILIAHTQSISRSVN